MSDSGLRFLYYNSIGRFFLGFLTRPGISRACGRFLDSSLSRGLIKGFIRRNGIDMSDYEEGPFFCFNDFFKRRVRDGKRPFDTDCDALVCPCDGLLSAYSIEKDTVFPVKQSSYDLKSLLDDEDLASVFEGGTCLVFRLCVDNYHRYAFFDSGRTVHTRKIAGKLHTVRPIALRREPVFIENSREYALLETDSFGEVIQMEVGAMLVGRIVNHEKKSFERGEEKGFFEYGGSTVIVLLKDGAAAVDDKYFENTEAEKETPVKMGEKIGHKA